MPYPTFSPATAVLPPIVSPHQDPVKLRYYDTHPGRSVFDRGTYTTIIAMHGSGFNSMIWTSCLPYLPQSVRVLAYNRRGYLGSSPAPDEAGDGGLAEQGILDLLGFVKFAVDELGVPARSEEGEAGIVILGWSRACVLLLGLLYHLALIPRLDDLPFGLSPGLTHFHSPLTSHLRAVILYEPPGNAVGIPPPTSAPRSPDMSPGKAFRELVRGTVSEEFHTVMDKAWEGEPVGKELWMVLATDMPTAERIAIDALHGVPDWCQLGLVYGTNTIPYCLQAAEWILAQRGERANATMRTIEGGGHFGMVTHAEEFVRRVGEVGGWRV